MMLSSNSRSRAGSRWLALVLAAMLTGHALAQTPSSPAGGATGRTAPSPAGVITSPEPEILAPLPGYSGDAAADPATAVAGPDQQNAPAPAAGTAASTPAPSAPGTTYRKDDLIGAAEGVFGKGAKGLAGVIEDLLRKQGEPNGYIVGREGGGALIVGLRYGSGTLHHKIEGKQPDYWTGPSIGLDAGANAAKSFVLIYNLHDTEDLYRRFGAGEGQAYFIAGFHVSYMRRGDIVLIPVRTGAGLRLGINAGYMKFSHKQKWLPF